MFLACNQIICRICLETLTTNKRCFCKQLWISKRSHIVTGTSCKLLRENLLSQPQLCDECYEILTWTASLQHECPEEEYSCVCKMVLRRKHQHLQQECLLTSIFCNKCNVNHNKMDGCVDRKI